MLEIVEVPGGFNVVDEEGNVLNDEPFASKDEAEAFRTDMMKNELMMGAGVGAPPVGAPQLPPGMPAPPMSEGMGPGGPPPMGPAGNPMEALLKKMGPMGK